MLYNDRNIESLQTMCVHAFDNGTSWTCTSYVKSHRAFRSLISTLQTRCMLLLVKILLAGWQCTSGCFYPPRWEATSCSALKLTPRSSGFGDSMTTSQMVIMWPNKDGSVTLSQRKASSHTQPQLDRAPQRTAQTYLAISAVSNCASYMLKYNPFDAWRIYFISAFIVLARALAPRSLIKHKTALGILLPDDDLQLAKLLETAYMSHSLSWQ